MFFGPFSKFDGYVAVAYSPGIRTPRNRAPSLSVSREFVIFGPSYAKEREASPATG